MAPQKPIGISTGVTYAVQQAAIYTPNHSVIRRLVSPKLNLDCAIRRLAWKLARFPQHGYDLVEDLVCLL